MFVINNNFKIYINIEYEKIIEKNYLINVISNIDDLFQFVVGNGYYKFTKHILNNSILNVNPRKNNNIIIYLAAEHGYYKIVKLLLKDGRIDLSSNSDIALRVAFINGHYKIVRYLVKDKTS